MHKDHLGSITAVTTGTTTINIAYDPWGKRYDPSGMPLLDNDSPGNYLTFDFTMTSLIRGFTGHEQLEHLGLVHMNGRVYDQEIGRFLSADQILQNPYNTQNVDRYAYVLNRPLSAVDPTGNVLEGFGKLIDLGGFVAQGLDIWNKRNSIGNNVLVGINLPTGVVIPGVQTLPFPSIEETINENIVLSAQSGGAKMGAPEGQSTENQVSRKVEIGVDGDFGSGGRRAAGGEVGAQNIFVFDAEVNEPMRELFGEVYDRLGIDLGEGQIRGIKVIVAKRKVLNEAGEEVVATTTRTRYGEVIISVPTRTRDLGDTGSDRRAAIAEELFHYGQYRYQWIVFDGMPVAEIKTRSEIDARQRVLDLAQELELGSVTKRHLRRKIRDCQRLVNNGKFGPC